VRELPSGLVSFCFVDVEGSTRAFASDPEGYPAALAAHHELVRSAFAAAGGVIVETEGDGLFAAFGDAAAAVTGCLNAQLAIGACRRPSGLNLRSRMGLHADDAVPAGDGYVALGVHQAARVAAAAHGGQVLCSASISAHSAGRLPPAAALAHLGSYRLKDFDLPAALFELRHPQLAGPFPPPRAPRVVATNLRLSRTSFVGRDSELSELRGLIGQSRMVTILGPGGVGKTRLAYRLAGELTDSFADGAWVVELDAVADPALVTDAVARALPLPAFAGGRPAEAVLAYLATRNLLLVVDNCEHVLAGAAGFVDQLLDVAQGVTVVATSRVPLDVLGEMRFMLGPLPLPPEDAALEELLDADAVRLFVARARAASSRFGLDAGNGAAVSAICRRLDGLPLALELAGARIATLEPGDLLGRLEDRFSVLAASTRGMPERHRTLQATLAWSYDLLSEAEQVLLTRLAVFAGRFPLDWIEQVCGMPPLTPAGVLDLLDGLVAKSLVVAEGMAGRTEYELLLTIREYAARRLAERGETDDLERGRADFLARHLAIRDPIFAFTADTGRYLVAVAAAADDVRASLAWCQAHDEAARACALIASVYRWWNVTGRIEELRPLARQAVALPAEPSLARLMTYYALLLGLDVAEVDARAEADACPGGEVRAASRRADEILAFSARMRDEMLALARQLGDDNAVALALYSQADLPWERGDFAEAARLYGEAAAAARRAGSDILAATIMRSAAEVSAEGDSARLAGSLDGVLGEFRRAGDPFGLAVTLAVLAGAELGCGETSRGVTHAAEGLRIAREHGYAEVSWRHQTLLAWGAAALGQAELGARLLGAVEAALDRAGGKIGAGQGGPADRERARALAAAVLSAERLAELRAAGRDLAGDEAIALALSVPGLPSAGC
jgi:predicted ATPase/class 3 adenylate cyclase